MTEVAGFFNESLDGRLLMSDLKLILDCSHDASQIHNSLWGAV